jgi:light-regulated signal transduction histidine kinase (bacteriophytochrome)
MFLFWSGVLKVQVNEVYASVEVDDLPEIEADVGQMAQVFQKLFSVPGVNDGL